MKSVIRILIVSIVLFFALAFHALSAEVNVIFPENEVISVQPTDSVAIPIRIKNNTGLMGFKINVSYPEEVLESPLTKRGADLNVGSYTDGTKYAKNGSFSIVWSNVRDFSIDGELFVLIFTVKSHVVPGDYVIRFSFSKDDTFNEKWENVPLTLRDVTVHVNENTGTSGSTTSTEGASEITSPPQELETDVLRMLLARLRAFLLGLFSVFQRMHTV